jgi:hypothetical protein
LREGAVNYDEEPTPGVGPCVEEWGIIEKETARILYGMLEPLDYNYVDLLILHEKYEVFIRVFIGLECLHLVEVRVRGCGETLEEIKKLSELPEFTRIMLEGECIEIAAPADMKHRVVKALEKIGIEPPVSPVAYRMVTKLVLDS